MLSNFEQIPNLFNYRDLYALNRCFAAYNMHSSFLSLRVGLVDRLKLHVCARKLNAPCKLSASSVVAWTTDMCVVSRGDGLPVLKYGHFTHKNCVYDVFAVSNAASHFRKKQRNMVTSKLRYSVLERDKFRCTACGAPAANTRLHVDHIRPVSKGGKTALNNLRTLCADCNIGKGSMWIGGMAA